MSKGIVVDHREARVRYAISESNFNEEVHKKIRDLKPGETVQGFQPRPIHRLGEAEVESVDTEEIPTIDVVQAEGSSSEGTKEH